MPDRDRVGRRDVCQRRPEDRPRRRRRRGDRRTDFAVTFTEGDAATLIEDPVDTTLADVDSATVAWLTITLTNLIDASLEVLDADVSAFPGLTKTSTRWAPPGFRSADHLGAPEE